MRGLTGMSSLWVSKARNWRRNTQPHNDGYQREASLRQVWGLSSPSLRTTQEADHSTLQTRVSPSEERTITAPAGCCHVCQGMFWCHSPVLLMEERRKNTALTLYEPSITLSVFAFWCWSYYSGTICPYTHTFPLQIYQAIFASSWKTNKKPL